MGLIGVLVPSTVFKTACDLRARLAGFDSQAVPPTFLVIIDLTSFFDLKGDFPINSH
ncbi:hypothetical protein KIS4809_3601 [Bacillus sp. ZZV12-4809]|nr:hypothetical protein KIS4809_3601 [Bacillus sp. ZZV12-4809]